MIEEIEFRHPDDCPHWEGERCTCGMIPIPAPRYYTVAFYNCDRAYGGPEEGGWYFDCGELIRPSRRFKSFDAACAYARRANRSLKAWQDSARVPEISSVLSRGRIHAEVHEEEPAKHYPEHQPHYC